jgi:hypothetical protein
MRTLLLPAALHSVAHTHTQGKLEVMMHALKHHIDEVRVAGGSDSYGKASRPPAPSMQSIATARLLCCAAHALGLLLLLGALLFLVVLPLLSCCIG